MNTLTGSRDREVCRAAPHSRPDAGGSRLDPRLLKLLASTLDVLFVPELS